MTIELRSVSSSAASSNPSQPSTPLLSGLSLDEGREMTGSLAKRCCQHSSTATFCENTNPLDRFGRIEPLSESGRVDSLWVFSHQSGSPDIPVPLALGGEDIGSWFGVVPSVPAGGDMLVMFGPSFEELVSPSTGDILECWMALEAVRVTSLLDKTWSDVEWVA